MVSSAVPTPTASRHGVRRFNRLKHWNTDSIGRGSASYSSSGQWYRGSGNSVTATYPGGNQSNFQTGLSVDGCAYSRTSYYNAATGAFSATNINGGYRPGVNSTYTATP